MDATGRSNISVQDYAVAMIDELERPKHIRERFTEGTESKGRLLEVSVARGHHITPLL